MCKDEHCLFCLFTVGQGVQSAIVRWWDEGPSPSATVSYAQLAWAQSPRRTSKPIKPRGAGTDTQRSTRSEFIVWMREWKERLTWCVWPVLEIIPFLEIIIYNIGSELLRYSVNGKFTYELKQPYMCLHPQQWHVVRTIQQSTIVRLYSHGPWPGKYSFLW